MGWMPRGQKSFSLRKVRDLTVMDIQESISLVIACDSLGGIGNKPWDQVQVPPETVGIFGVRVPLFEVIASGGVPIHVSDCLAVEMEDTGRRIVEGIRSYCAEAGVTEENQFNGSTEENVLTLQTGIGIMVTGWVEQGGFFPGCSEAGDVILCAGIPKSGPQFQISIEDPELLSLQELICLRKDQGVGDLLPVGSKGIKYEAEQLAESAGLSFQWKEDVAVDLHRSGGPASCAVFSSKPGDMDRLAKKLTTPLHQVGYLF